MYIRQAKKAGWIILVVLLAIQLIRPARNISGQVLPTDIKNIITVPLNVQVLLQTSCYDCHSNHTNYPWYANLQPVGWLLNNHVQNGKKQLNFSDFGSYSTRRQLSKLKAIGSQVQDGEMPLLSYTWMHSNAKLRKEDKILIINWARQAMNSISVKN